MQLCRPDKAISAICNTQSAGAPYPEAAHHYWWGGMDSNHRGVMNTADLQSAAFSLSATSPNFVGVLLAPNQAVAYSRPRLAVTRAGTVALQTSRALPRLSGGKCRIRTCEALWARPLSRRVLSTAQPTFRGGSGRIRTLGAFRPIGFLDRCLKPLSHTSGVWEELGPGACNFPVSPAFTTSSSPLDPFSSSRRCCLLLTRKQPTGRSVDLPGCASSGELSP